MSSLRTRTPAALAVTVLAVGAMVVPPAAAQLRRNTALGVHVPGSMGVPQPEPRVNLTVKQRSLGRVLYEIFKLTPYKYEVKEEVGNQLFDLDVKNMPLTQALRTLLAQDKSKEPMVFGYSGSHTGEGTFLFYREHVEVGEIEGENRVSVANGRLTTVLPLVFKQMGAKFRIEPDVPPVLISLQLRPMKWDQVLPQVVTEAHKQEPGLTYSQDGDTYVVHLHKMPTTLSGPLPPGAKAIRKVKLSFNRTPLRDALAELFKESEWKYQVADGVKDSPITYSATAEPEFAALAAILKQASSSTAPVTYREGTGVVYIEPGPLPGQALAGLKGGTAKQPRTSLTVMQQPLSKVIKSLAGPLGVKVEIADDVPDIPINLNLVDGTLEDAVAAISAEVLKQIPNITVKKLGENSFRLELKKK